ncbi:MAG: hypothetical protein NT01SARS_0318 [SAR86 cluster bacterium SAR86A]|uniref:Uncharacterized protein n=1 Tax=SAR86 cluster bacterium SAR86A TaxID=1123866 RepID=J5K7U3_9GAMM|nr:MAG: hypothetical protein NT01SARS_0318 [SAR86 cluster bacterium SAR86A]
MVLFVCSGLIADLPPITREDLKKITIHFKVKKMPKFLKLKEVGMEFH